MSKAELLAKMTPHGIVITGAGFGGTVRIDMMEVAGALGMGGLDHSAYLFGLLKYCMDHHVIGRIERIMRGHVAALSRAYQWGLTDAQIAGMAQLAILENLHDTVCRSCNGSAQVAAKPCEACNGSGRVPMSNRKRAALVGVAETSWRRDWRDRANQCYQVVSRWDADVTAHLAEHFGARSAFETAG